MPSPSFSTLPPSKPDPIFAVAAAARAAGPQAIDGTIGVYMDEHGKTTLFPSVRSAIVDISAELPDRSYAYRALLGLPEFRSSVLELIFGDKVPCSAAIASTGGTGAVALNLRLAKLMHPEIAVIVPTPPWANHPPLCRAAGVRAVEVPYLHRGKPTIEGIADELKQEQGGCAALLQVGCHNPTGLDFDRAQWDELHNLLRKHEAIPILDLAYQGFAGEPAEDAAVVRMFAESGPVLIAWSASKNHSLYSERVGLACAVTPDESTKAEVEAHYSTITRGIHSAAATFGQSIVARTQMAYKDQWIRDMADARHVLAEKRRALRDGLPTFMHPSLEGNGMFAMLPLTPEQIRALQRQHNVFMTNDGRINIAGIPMKRMEELADAICDICL